MLPLARQERLLVREVGEDVVIYDLERHCAHRLNRSAALVWRCCDGRTPAEVAAALLQRELGLPADGAVVSLALEQLARADLLREPLPPPGAGALTRRGAMRKLGGLGGLGGLGALALLLPAVASITSPTPARGQSAVATTCLGRGGNCVLLGACRISGGTNVGVLDCLGGLICCVT